MSAYVCVCVCEYVYIVCVNVCVSICECERAYLLWQAHHYTRSGGQCSVVWTHLSIQEVN